MQDYKNSDIDLWGLMTCKFAKKSILGQPVKTLCVFRFCIYAYDAYYLQCCVENKLPLISLDDRMCDAARNLSIKVVE